MDRRNKWGTGRAPARRSGGFLPGLLLAVLTLGTSTPLAAQHPPPGARQPLLTAQEPPLAPPPAVPRTGSDSRIGLALSGGAAKGLAHVGVLRVLEDAGVAVDLLVGTSMGSVVGGLYAVGYSPEQVARVARAADWDRLFNDAPERRNLPPARKGEVGRWVVTLPVRDGRPRLPGGFIAGQRISQFLTRLTWEVHPVHDFGRLPLPFAAVATDAETGDAVRLERGYLPEAIRASLAIPGIFAPVEIDGRLLTDGGLTRNLPAEDARALGANVIICSDVSKPLVSADSLDNLLAVLDQTIAYRSWASTAEQRKLCDVLILPEIEGLSQTRFDRADEWLRRGEAAARAALPELERMGLVGPEARSARRTADCKEAAVHPMEEAVHPREAALPTEETAFGSKEPAGAALEDDSVYVIGVQVEGATDSRAREVIERLGVTTPGWVRLNALDDAVTRLHDTGLFRRVQYRLEDAGSTGTGSRTAGDACDASGHAPRAGGDGRTAGGDDAGGTDRRRLRLRVVEQTYAVLGFGYRYESRYKGALLASVAAAEIAGAGSHLGVDLRIGDQGRAEGTLTWRLGHRPTFLLGAEAGYRRMPYDVYVEDLRTSSPRAYVSHLEASAGVGLWSTAVASFRVKGEFADLDEFQAAGEPFTARNEWFYTVGGTLRLDSFDRASFPRSGAAALAKLEWADRSIGSGLTFQHHVVDLRAAVAATSRLSLLGRLVLGTSTGDELPDHYRFFLGGTNEYYLYPDRHFPFAGLRTMERNGRHLQMAQLGVQYQFDELLLGRVRGNAGAALEEWEVDAGLLDFGLDLTVAAVTRFGTAALSVTSADFETVPRIVVDVGFPF